MDTPLIDRPAPDLFAIIRGRRSVRRYGPDPVEEAVIERVLETAVWAPSAHNRQPWRFRVLREAADKAGLADAMGRRLRADRAADDDDAGDIARDVAGSRARITQAPVVIAVCLTMADMDSYPDAGRRDAERAMAVQSTAMAAHALLLAAHAEGLGACWMCAPLFCPETVAETLALPADWEPQALITLGYPAGPARPGARRPAVLAAGKAGP